MIKKGNIANLFKNFYDIIMFLREAAKKVFFSYLPGH